MIEDMSKQYVDDSDVISRQAAIDAAIEGADDWDGGYNLTREEYIKKAINALPSVTPMPCEDAIGRHESIAALIKHFSDDGMDTECGAYWHHAHVIDVLQGMPPVKPQDPKWIPITYRPMTDDEKKDYSERTGYDEEDLDIILNCQLPEDGETVLITDRIGNVEVDTFVRDCDGCYFECNCDMEDVKAWMPLPAPYEGAKIESEEQA